MTEKQPTRKEYKSCFPPRWDQTRADSIISEALRLDKIQKHSWLVNCFEAAGFLSGIGLGSLAGIFAVSVGIPSAAALGVPIAAGAWAGVKGGEFAGRTLRFGYKNAVENLTLSSDKNSVAAATLREILVDNRTAQKARLALHTS